MAEVEDRLRRRILERGPIPFARFMEEALYGEHGYYTGERLPIGEGGDYVTGSSLSPLFGRATGRLLSRLDRALERPAELLEVGYGSGDHLAAVALAGGGERRIRAWDRVARPLPAGVEPIASLEVIAAREIEGLIFSYELFDALPVHRLIKREREGLGELFVALAPDGRFRWQEGELSDPALADLLGGWEAELRRGQVADLSPEWAPLYRRLCRLLGRGLVVTFDYGFERQRLLDPRVRRHGTLACYRRHRVHRNPFVAVGSQDMTAHVDFTALRRAGEEAGLITLAFTRQARWLTACGIFDDLRENGAERREQARVLLDGDGMGEEIRVLVQCRDVDPGELFDSEVLGAANGWFS